MVHILGQNKQQGVPVDNEMRKALDQMALSLHQALMKQGAANPAGALEWSNFLMTCMQTESQRMIAEHDALKTEEEKQAYRDGNKADQMGAGVVDFIAQYAVKVAQVANPMKRDANGIPILSTTDAARMEMEKLYAFAMIHAMANVACEILNRFYSKQETRQ